MDAELQKEGIFKEYEALREEILHSDRLVVQVLSLVSSAVAVIFAQGLISGNPYVFLIPFPILWIASYFVADKRWVIWLIASYLRRYVESQGWGPRWETRLHAFRTRVRESGKAFIPGQNVIRNEILFFNMFGLLNAILFVVTGVNKGMSLWYCLIPIAALAALLLLTILTYRPILREGRKGGILDEMWPD